MSALFTTAWLEARKARKAENASLLKWRAKNATEERDLHLAIIQYLKERRWLYVHQRMDVPSTADVFGIPDFVILVPGNAFRAAHVLLIECKSSTGELSDHQVRWRDTAREHGFEYHEARTLAEFLEVVR